MARSLKKGPYIDENVMKKVQERKPEQGPIKTWARSSTITPEMIGFTFSVHNGKQFIEVGVTEDMVGHKLGEFSATTKFQRHGGKVQKEVEQKKGAPAPASAKK